MSGSRDDRDGSDPRRLTDADVSEHFPAWSPDGTTIVYATWNGEDGHLFFRAPADRGRAPVRLTREPAAYYAPAWGPGDPDRPDRRPHRTALRGRVGPHPSVPSTQHGLRPAVRGGRAHVHADAARLLRGPWAENYFYSRDNPHDGARLRRFVPHDEVDARTLRRPQWFRTDQHVFARHARFVRALVEAGGRAGVGSHGQLQGLGYHWELWAMAADGMDAHDALRMATILGAEALGLDGDVGSIEPGKLADLVILSGNPLENLRHTNTVERVMMNGRLYDADTLDEVHPRERSLEPLWWWDDEPEGVPGLGR